MDLDELKEVVARGEDSMHQFKENIRNSDSLAAEMVAFSNSQGGRIFIGITDEGKFEGLGSADRERVNQLISNSASQHVRSPIAVQSENISVNSDRTVIVVSVSEGIDKPYFDHHGVIWLKSGADKRRVNSKEELRRLFQDVDLLHADEVPTRCGLEGFDTDLFARFLLEAYQERLPKTSAARLRLLENMNLAVNKQLNLAGLLLFGKRPQIFKPEFTVKAICYPGLEIADQYLDSEDFAGSLTQIFQGALNFILRNMRKVQNEKSVNTLGSLEIPQAVFEELLVNALVHRDYFIAAPIRLFIFDNRIEIINPGHLPDHLTVEKIRAGNSIQRNPILASFIAKNLLPYRGLGTGIRRALKHWPHIGFIEDREGALFISNIHRLKVQNAPRSAPKNASLTPLQKQIVDLIASDVQASYNTIAEAVGKDRTTVMRNIQKLKQYGILHRVGSKKSGTWKVCP